ncbi:hypothetical protein H0H87_002870 [Tephrocybe sp. NHM501043]|nr:hypothetical protein H0H87_002870 [Tephrocybe sp. NHM501043]
MSTVAAKDSDWRRVSSGPAPPFSIFNKPIQKSEQDDRDYRLIQLDNGLQATLIHDANADKAAASLDVAVGHLYDPDDMPGLAHFCEHLLFMGTEQFPKENEYSEYLAKNNGSSNAYTSTSNTNYYFNVATPALSGALERFSGFFHSPLFAPSCTTRELNAVDSEHKKNHQTDMWRIFQLNKHLSKEGHPWNKFGSGNKDSLSKAAKILKAKGLLVEDESVSYSGSVDPSPDPSRRASPAPSTNSATSEPEADGGAVGRETRRRLVEWWSREYCASRMRLCVIGKEHHRDIIHATFQYLALLRASKFDAYHQTEIAKVSNIRFRFKEKRRPDEYATALTEYMSWPVPKELVLKAPEVTWDWDADVGDADVLKLLETFRVSEGRVVLMATAAEHAKVVPADATWETEPWYGTRYRVEQFDEQFLQAPNAIPGLFLPLPNEFIPTDLQVEKRSTSEPINRPHLIQETPLLTLWHKKDDRFFVPKAHAVIDIRSGYNDKLSVLVGKVLETVKSLAVNCQRLEVMKEQNQREWRNFFLGQSYTLSDYFGRYLLTADQWTLEEKLKELPTITAEEIQIHVERLLSQVNLRILVAGNIYKNEALKIAEIAQHGLGVSPLSPAELNDRALILAKGSNHTWTCPIPNPNQANSSLTYYVHFGPIVEEKLRVVSSLLTQVLSEPAFNVLRTQEQLGYIVHCAPWSLAGSSEKGLRIVVQSEKTPGYLEERVEAFLDGMKSTIENMSEAEFMEQKNGLERKWLEKDKNLADETSYFVSHITTGQWDFLRRETDARLLKSVTKEDLLQLFLTHVHPSSATRSKLSVHMISQKPRPKKVSVAASQAFDALLRQAGIEVGSEAWKKSLGGDGTPLATDFANYWKQVFETQGNAVKLLDAIPELVEKYPVPGEGKDIPRSDVSYIKDLNAFKAGLTPSVNPGPMVQWGDLPVSRF